MARWKYTDADGNRLSSVTEIISKGLGGYGLQGLMGWANKVGREGKTLNEARLQSADVGTLVHGLVARFVQGEELTLERPEGIPDAEWPQMADSVEASFGAFKEWWRDRAIVIQGVEEQMVSWTHRFGGTLDARGRYDGMRVVFDWKSSKQLYGTVAVQLAAYRQLCVENLPEEEWPMEAVALRIGKDGGLHEVRLSAEDLNIAWRAFVTAMIVKQFEPVLDAMVEDDFHWEPGEPPPSTTVEMSEDWIGKYVTYMPDVGGPQRGLVKAYDNETQTAFVVYNWRGADPDWRNYTAQGTPYDRIKELK